MESQFIRDVALEREKVSDWDAYPFNVPVIRNLSHLQLNQQVTFFVGENGEGFLDLVMNRLHGNGLYLFDEPEAALSPKRQLSLIALLHSLVRKGSQLIIATHSQIVMEYHNAMIYSFADGAISSIRYEETDHFQVTDSFLKRRERTLRELMAE